MKIEKTLVILKPDAVERGLVGEIISRFEKVGLKIVGMKEVWPTAELASDHYGDVDVRYSPAIKKSMVDYMSAGPVVAMILDGVGAIEKVRLMVGNTYPHQAMPGTIRGDYAHVAKDYINSLGIADKNLIHASANKEDFDKEFDLWFKDSEVFDYEATHEKHTRR